MISITLVLRNPSCRIFVTVPRSGLSFEFCAVACSAETVSSNTAEHARTVDFTMRVEEFKTRVSFRSAALPTYKGEPIDVFR